MARRIPGRDISSVLAAARQWIDSCLIEDRAVLSESSLWSPALVEEVYRAFVEHPDFGDDDFMTKLIKQMNPASAAAQQLMAEMLWALLLFPSNVRATTKRSQVQAIWELSGQSLVSANPLLREEVLFGIGSGGPGFNNYRPKEMEFLIALTRDLKRKPATERRLIFASYEAFTAWIVSVPQEGLRQFRHMLRYFAFPDQVERMSSNRDRKQIIEAFKLASKKQTDGWTDQQLDEALQELRSKLQLNNPSGVFDFYDPAIKEQWASDRRIRTLEGELTVEVPTDEDETEDEIAVGPDAKAVEVRQSIQVQAKLARIGATMGFKVWIPNGDRGRVCEVVSAEHRSAFLQELPLNYNNTTVDTIKAIDVLWLRQRSIVRAFEVEHTTAVYSGLLRMADLLALQPNMNIRLHIVAPDERKEKVFREMRRPVFSLLEGGPLSGKCSFISYESVDNVLELPHLAEMKESIIAKYEESPGTEMY